MRCVVGGILYCRYSIVCGPAMYYTITSTHDRVDDEWISECTNGGERERDRGGESNQAH